MEGLQGGIWMSMGDQSEDIEKKYKGTSYALKRGIKRHKTKII